MGKPQNRVKIEWSPNFAYAIGLLVTDGSLSKDRRHVCFTSKDLELINNFQECLRINYHLGLKGSGTQKEKKYYVIQIGDVNFYKYLLSLGLMPNKTKIIQGLQIPDPYFFDFLRGHLDGDGSFYSYWDSRWHSSFMFYTAFASASKDHIFWLRSEIFKYLEIRGHISINKKKMYYQLRYAKTESIKLLNKIYYSQEVICLNRKRLKIENALSIIKQTLNFGHVEKLVNSLP